MKDIIAKLDLVCVRSSGERLPVTVEIGRPYDVRDGKDGDCAACPVALHGLHGNLHDIYGGDTFQALLLATGLVRRLLADFVAKGGRLFYSDGKTEFDFGAHFDDRKT